MGKRKDHENKGNFVEIVRRIAAGQARALKEFYAVYGKMMFLAALTVCRNNVDAREAINRVLTKLWLHADVAAGVRDPDAWLFTVTRRTATEIVKGYKWPTSPKTIPAADEYCRVYESDEFYFLICDLTETEQAVVIYKYIRNMTFDRIAEATGCPADEVASAYYGALAKIEAKLAKQKI